MRKQQTKNGNTNHRKTGHNTLIGHGLDEKIQADNRQNTIGRKHQSGKERVITKFSE